MDAKGICAVRGILYNLCDGPFQKATFDLCKPCGYQVAWSASFEEDHQTIDFCHTLAFSCHGVDPYILN
jgi:hypothetical protein